MRKTESKYYDALVKWSNDHKLYNGLCQATKKIKDNQDMLSLFEPNESDLIKFKVHSAYWGESDLTDKETLNDFRTMALLLMNEIELNG